MSPAVTSARLCNWRKHEWRETESTLTPVTVAGLWIAAILSGDNYRRRQLTGMLNAGKTGWNSAEVAVVQAACEIVLRRYFKPDYDVRDVTEFARYLRQASGQDLGTGLMQAEALLRHALGETEISISDLTLDARVTMLGVAAGVAVRKLGLDSGAVNEMVMRAEEEARVLGWKVPLADARAMLRWRR